MPDLKPLEIVAFPPTLPRDLCRMADAILAGQHTLSTRGLALAVMIHKLFAFVEGTADEDAVYLALDSFFEELWIPEVQHDYQS